MRIGSVQITSIVDGEILGSPELIYPQVDLAAIRKYPGHLDSVSGAFILALGGFLVEIDDRLILIDVGIGPKPTYPNTGGAFRNALLARGVKLNDITDVILTHLHYDHLGWISRDGHPMFPNATLHCDRRDWNLFVDPDSEGSRNEFKFLTPENSPQTKLAPFEEGTIAFWEGEAEILPGLRTLDAPGHTPGTVVFEITSAGERGIILGDVAHTVPELLEAWPFSVAEDPVAADASLRWVRDLVAEEGIPCVGSHFVGMRWGRVHKDQGQYHWTELEDQ
jgi:glyoxylase-like metal-dependent hydrolase (beta-lactamase superfamily II)